MKAPRNKRHNFLLVIISVALAVSHPLLAQKPNGGFRSEDIGDPKLAGKVEYKESSQRFKISGSGYNIWNEHDEFHFAYQAVEGDFVLSANLKFLGKGVEAHRKIGLMVRDSKNSESISMNGSVHGDGLTALQYRKATSGNMSGEPSEIKSPERIQIERQGNEFFFRVSKDGSPWIDQGSVELNVGNTVYAGMFVCSHNPEVIEKAEFWNVQLEKKYWSPIISENVGNVDKSTLSWLAQLGAKWVVLQGTDWVDTEGKGYWTPADIEPIQKRCREFGMELYSMMIPLSWIMSPMLEKPDRDKQIENICRSIRAAGEQGIQMMEWRWSPDFKWGDDVGYYEVEGRGGATYKAFDYSIAKNKPSFPELGIISREQMWDRLIYFCGPVMKAAEEAGVKMSLHPKDPPVKEMRGIARVLTNTDEIIAFLDAVDSPANGFTFCQGTVTEMGVDVIDAIRRIGGRGKINHVHFRAVRGQVPNYVETFIDEGDVDMLEAIKAFKEVNYTGSLVSDHTPKITGDIEFGKLGRSFSHGYIRALVHAANAEQ